MEKIRKIFENRLLKLFLFVLSGALGGYAYYYFIGCNGGSCPITSNPYISTTYGMAIGLLLSFDKKKKKEER